MPVFNPIRRSSSPWIAFLALAVLGSGCGRVGFEALDFSAYNPPQGGSASGGAAQTGGLLTSGGTGITGGQAASGGIGVTGGAATTSGGVAGGGALSTGGFAVVASPLDLSQTDGCEASGTCASQVDMCSPGDPQTWPGVCGCSGDDGLDTDGDGTPDCIDYCIGEIDRTGGGQCGCPEAEADDDNDGVVNCDDGCPTDPNKTLPGICGCAVADDDSDADGLPDCADGCPADGGKGVPGTCGCGVPETDADSDGVPDCVDACPADGGKTAPGVCGCGTPDIDSDDDGTPDCVDACDGVNDASYVSDASCGVGYCRATNTPSTCVAGVETACMPGAPQTANDASCDGVDNDCDGTVDEDAAPVATSCGIGACAATGTLTCSGGVETDSCTPGLPAANDATPDGIDDDCDGLVDEDVPVCDTTPIPYTEGGHLNLTVPAGCTQLNVYLWGGGGASGEAGGYWGSANGGNGGAGGYAYGRFAVAGGDTFALQVGRGGQGCTGAGQNDDAAYSGGAGGSGNGANGVAGESRNNGGGAGGTGAGDGGRGDFGGGGGGAGGGPAWNPNGNGAGGGAASVLLLRGSRVMVAGGGGGGGGVGSTIASSGLSGGAGGTGCSGTGANASGGGGGGGGLCSVSGAAASDTQTGSGRTPHNPGGSYALPSGRATGAQNSDTCIAGGNGYAFVSFAP